MKILKSIQKNKGYGLILALAFVLIMLVLMASTLRWATSDSKATQRNNQFVNSQYAAEGAVENAVAEFNFDYLFGNVTNSSAYAGVPTNINNWPIQYIFSNPNIANGNNTNQIYVNIGNVSTNTQPLTGIYDGLNAFIQQCDFAATATPVGQLYNVPATVRESLWASQIPIYQFLIFYNLNLEINAAQTLDARGPVFSNAGFWSGTPNVTFYSTVLCVSNGYNQTTDPFANYTGSGKATFKLYANNLPETGVSPLTIPVAGVSNTNNSPAIVHKILEWPPAAYALGTADAYTTNGLTYMANMAGFIISNSINGTNWGRLLPHGTNIFMPFTNFAVYYQDSTYVSGGLNSNPHNMANSLIWVTNDFYIITNSKMASAPRIYFTNYVSPTLLGTNANGYTNILYAGYSFLTNVLFYDWREGWSTSSSVKHGKPVQAVQFDVAAYNKWLADTRPNGGKYYNDLSQSHWHHSIGGIYIYTSVTNTTTNLPAVRVVNGSQLFDSYGLTVATPFPLYVKGDYNVSDGSGSNAGQNSTTHARPAGLMGDAITFLSSSWNDSRTNKTPNSSSTATLNAAILAGIVPSDPDLGTPKDDSDYSGGVENFFRLLEDWGTFYYNGSIIVMFPSQYATNRWRQTGNFYGAPTRKWAFDTNFNTQVKLPPMTPNVKVIIRSTWSGH